MPGYAMYLRKSRADVEAEARGEGETLAKHEKALTELAKRQNLSIIKRYKEIVSGENIAARPQMQALLADVSNGIYEGVLVMEIERLARGDTIDQGVVAQAFKSSHTKIITPIKNYDPNNEYDEEYFEFSLFMSRREYKTIRRRMNAGRIATIKDGNYITPVAPYGYKKIHPEPKVYTLEIIPEQAEIIKLIFSRRLQGIGSRAIAAELNSMGISPLKSKQWERVSVKKILENPVYAGKIHWRSQRDGNIICDGRHEAIISEDVFNQVQNLIDSHPLAHTNSNSELLNYYSGLLYCKNCGHQLTRRYINTSGKAHLLCRYNSCRGLIVSSSMDAVDEALKEALSIKISKLKYITTQNKKTDLPLPDKRPIIEAEMTKLLGQKSKIYDLLEQGVYSTDEFLERSATIASKIQKCESELKALDAAEPAPKIPDDELLVRLNRVLEEFDGASPTEKNQLLKSIIRRIDYSKTKRQCYNDMSSDMQLDIDFL